MSVGVSWSRLQGVDAMGCQFWSLGLWGSHCCGGLVPHASSHFPFRGNQGRSFLPNRTMYVPLPLCGRSDGATGIKCIYVSVCVLFQNMVVVVELSLWLMMCLGMVECCLTLLNGHFDGIQMGINILDLAVPERDLLVCHSHTLSKRRMGPHIWTMLSLHIPFPEVCTVSDTGSPWLCQRWW